MMITPEMMEQLGGKRGKARGPDMTNREIGDADGQEDYGGAASLEEAVGDWEGGRKRKRKKPKGKAKAKEKEKKEDEIPLGRMRSELLTACVKHRNVSGAYALFLEGVEDGEPPPEAQCAALIEQLCTRGMGANCRTALAAMADHGYKLTVRLCTMTVGALLRSGQPMRGFEVFAEHLERAGAAADGAAVGSLAASDALNLNELAICSSTGRAASASSFAVPLHAQSSRGKRPAS